MKNSCVGEINQLHPDWPLIGSYLNGSIIDLSVHDLPHKSSDLEWWYINCLVKDDNNIDYSLFGCMFQVFSKKLEKMIYCPQFSILNMNTKKNYTYSLMENDFITETEHYISEVLPSKSNFEKKTFEYILEILKKKNLPQPDNVSNNNALSEDDRLSIKLDQIKLEKIDNKYYWTMLDADMKNGFNICLTPNINPVLHGMDGRSKVNPSADGMFYYFIPDCTIAGTIINDKKSSNITGSGWYDHEFGGNKDDSYTQEAVGWTWFSMRLDDDINGVKFITAYHLTDSKEKEIKDSVAIIIDKSGTNKKTANIDLIPIGDKWTSNKTFIDYNIKYNLKFNIENINVDIITEPIINEQEVISIMSYPAYWEGRIKISGTINGSPVSGFGYMERNGYNKHKFMNDYLKSVSKYVLKQFDQIIPANPTKDNLNNLFASEDFSYYTQYIDSDVGSYVLNPIREICLRGGKAWRSLSIALVCNMFGGDSSTFDSNFLLPMAEILHTSSLIIDDIEDQSNERRNGPTAHKIFDLAQCINSGCTGYFIFDYAIRNMNISNDQRLLIYQYYMLCLKSAHLGQGFDIMGLNPDEDPELLWNKLLNIHLLKSGVAAGLSARIGAIIANADLKHIEDIGKYFETMGVVFQIMDDVYTLNNDAIVIKEFGDDILQGKLTAPLIAILKYLDPITKNKLISLSKKHKEIHNDNLNNKSNIEYNIDDIKWINDLLTQYKCITYDDLLLTGTEYCKIIATKMLSEAWNKIDDIVVDSYFKIQLKLFSEYILIRDY
jgi:geranylgeranyl pyrophosphate synthase/predicted secreted hydrolase